MKNLQFALMIAVVGWGISSAGAAEGGLRLAATVDGQTDYVSGMGVLAIPGQQIHIALAMSAATTGTMLKNGGTTVTASVTDQFKWTVDQGELLSVMGSDAIVECPKESGTCHVTVSAAREARIAGMEGKEATESKEGSFNLSIFVQFPYNREGRGIVDNYPIGIYPDENAAAATPAVREHADKYRPPQWFARVAKSERGILISPHFKIGEFCTPYTDEDPTYVAISPRLIARLEALRDHLVAPDRKNPRLVILRAFLSPNEIGQLKRKGLKTVEFNRYQYGDAAAVIVDEDGDGVMDDLNKDGKSDYFDVDYLSRIVEQIERESKSPGGIFMYPGPSDPLLPKTPYLSIDCRGLKARKTGTTTSGPVE
ncbi:MAG: hypothetical protein NTX50_22195 [Candidatus Sumerlaeota bacterium]|nr:hypothetical protein [Candidatus Sumerlaeota bacterium]